MKMSLYTKFHGNDNILVFDFLIGLTEELNTLNVTEAQGLLRMPIFLGQLTTRQYLNARRDRKAGVKSWFEVVQNLFTTYGTSAVIGTAYRSLCYLGDSLKSFTSF